VGGWEWARRPPDGRLRAGGREGKREDEESRRAPREAGRASQPPRRLEEGRPRRPSLLACLLARPVPVQFQARLVERKGLQAAGLRRS